MNEHEGYSTHIYFRKRGEGKAVEVNYSSLGSKGFTDDQLTLLFALNGSDWIKQPNGKIPYEIAVWLRKDGSRAELYRGKSGFSDWLVFRTAERIKEVQKGPRVLKSRVLK